MINFVYCFDENYNFQAFSSMISLLDKVSEKVNIFVIHRIQNRFDFIPDAITKHKNLNKIEIKKFQKNINDYPNLFNSHVSEATYYRLFIEDYLPEDIEFFVYLDADIICVQDPIDNIKFSLNQLRESTKMISAKTEINNNSDIDADSEIFNRLGIKSHTYFNAGLILVNYKLWFREKPKKDFLKILNDKGENLFFWDQDILNIYFDGRYLELDKRLNYVIDLATYIYTLLRKYKHKKLSSEDVQNENFFVHYAGSHKPWSVDGIACNLSEFYHENFRKINKNKYHLVHKRKRLSVLYLIKNIFNLNLFKIRYFFGFIKSFITSFF
tara:strand:- start:548 stop:1525 length:978 start_codon:yes stop_codon:yes gene_type:complete